MHPALFSWKVGAYTQTDLSGFSLLLDLTHLNGRYETQNPSLTIKNEKGVKGNPVLAGLKGSWR